MARWKRLLPERIYSRAISVAERFGPCVDNTAMDSEILVGCFNLFPSTKAGPGGGFEIAVIFQIEATGLTISIISYPMPGCLRYDGSLSVQS